MTTTMTPPALAIDGGPKACSDFQGPGRNKIGMEEFLSVAERFGFSAEAIARMRATLSEADMVAGGPNFGRYYTANPKPPKGEQYEALVRELFGVKHAYPVSSGTAALHCAMAAVGAKPGTEVIVPAMGFVATGMAGALLGAKPVFCDVDTSLQMDPAKLERLINERTVAIAPTHHWGIVADMDPIMAIARRHGVKVIEDCAQAPGATYRGRRVGSIGDLGCFSISCYKIIGGGESGMVTTSDEKLFDRVRQMAEAGGLWRPDRFAPARWPDEIFVGTNYRLSELEAAVNVVQIQKLDSFIADYRRSSRRVLKQLKRFRQITPQKHNDPAGDIGYMIRFFAQSRELAQKIAAALSAEGLGCGLRGSRPDWHIYHHMSPIKDNFQTNATVGDCPVADALWEREMAVSIGMGLAESDADMIAAALNKVLTACCTEDPAAPAWI